jgi:hypothetical protein
MSSQPRTESPGSKSRVRLPSAHAAEDEAHVPLGEAAPPTDDTPTIISRHSPNASAEGDPATGIRGRRLAHFELIEPIGVGGMAAVLRARDTQLDRLVALKILPPEMSGDGENVKRFHQEARSAAKLDHENIARVFFCGEDQRLHFIAFEFVEGENLRTLIERRGLLPADEALRYMLQVAAGLAHASRRGVVHRDIKPSNIIITPHGRAKLVDMGLARCLEGRSDHDLTQSGVTLGTFDYISPEQALEPREADVRSDIYSLGCTFYHALTGWPPVPEGTAAKKLHCHQHVKPVDPRQYAPDLPVEVVQILDRMMAKQPRDRFQSPEQLVHQLWVVARKLGVCGEAPEGVLTVEADVPNPPPASRPLVWAALAGAAVVALVLLLDQAPPARDGGRLGPVASDGGEGPVKDKKSSTPRVEEDKAPPRRVEAGPEVAVYTPPSEPSAQHLLRWLSEHRDATRIELRLAGDLDLSPREGTTTGLTLARQHVTIKAHDPRQKPTLRFHYHGNPTDKPLVAVAVNARESLVEGVRFVIDVHGAPDIGMVGLLLEGGRHTVRRCEFVQARPSLREDGKRMASLVAEAGRLRPEVTLKDCSFLGFGKVSQEADGRFEAAVLSGAETGGQDAVVRRGAVRIKAEGCVFGPHSAAFRLEGDGGGDEGLLTVRHCSVLLPARRSAAFEAPSRGTGRLDVAHSLFSRLPGDDDADGSVLLREAEDAETVAYAGKDNRYHNLDGYWAVGGAWQQASWGDFHRRLNEGRGNDEQSRLLVFSPWDLEPALQVTALDGQALKEAFAVRLTLAALRKLGRSPAEVVGAEAVLGERWLPATLPALPEKGELGVRRFLVVERGENDSSNGLYDSLDAAVANVRPGDTILIRHNGELAINPVHLNKKGLSDLTIRPARRFRPVLVLGETAELETSLFRLHEGKLRLEALEFRLTPPRRKKPTLQTLVALAGDGECSLRQCVVTLQQSGETRLALATLTEPGKVMKLDMLPTRSRDQGPKLSLEGCFVRGEGDLLWTRATRPFGLEAKRTLAALSGSLLSLGVLPDARAPEDSQRTQVSLQDVTAYVGGPLVRLATGKDPCGLVPLTIKASNSLFVPAGTGKTMISLEGSDTEDKTLRDMVAWEGGPNTYGAFKTLLAQQPAGDEMPMHFLGPEKWKTQPGEDSSVFAAELVKSPPDETRFSRMEPGQFAPPRDAADSGAPLAALPKPTPAGGEAKER